MDFADVLHLLQSLVAIENSSKLNRTHIGEELNRHKKQNMKEWNKHVLK